jgi:hypothetical protein
MKQSTTNTNNNSLTLVDSQLAKTLLITVCVILGVLAQAAIFYLAPFQIVFGCAVIGAFFSVLITDPLAILMLLTAIGIVYCVAARIIKLGIKLVR